MILKLLVLHIVEAKTCNVLEARSSMSKKIKETSELLMKRLTCDINAVISGIVLHMTEYQLGDGRGGGTHAEHNKICTVNYLKAFNSNMLH